MNSSGLAEWKTDEKYISIVYRNSKKSATEIQEFINQYIFVVSITYITPR